MIKILQVVGAMDMGGAEAMLMNAMRVIDREKYQFIFLCYINIDREYAYEDEVKRLGGKIVRIEDTRKSSPRRFIKSIERVIKEEKVDVVHGHADLSSAYAMIAAKKSGVRARIVHSHNAKFSAESSLPGRAFGHWARRTIKRDATTLIAVEEDAGQAMYGESDFVVLKNGIDFERFAFDKKTRQKIRNDLGVEDDGTLVLHVGRFERAKNHEFVIDAFKSFAEKGDKATLLLIGAGSLEQMIREKIANLGLQDRVVILSNVQDVERYYSAADLFIFPSLYEGLGIVLIEAQINGLPCLASDSIESVIELSNRIERLPISDASLWVKKMYKLKQGRKGQKVTSGIKQYAVSETSEELCKIYDDLSRLRVAFHIADITKTGGTEKVTLQVAGMLKDRYQISIISTMRDGNPFFKIDDGIKVSYIYDKKISVKREFLPIVSRLRKMLREQQIDVLVGVDSMQSTFDLSACAGLATKYVAWEHFNYNVNLDKKLRDVGRKLAARFADRIVVLTDSDAKIWKKHARSGRKIKRIYNSVENNESVAGRYDLNSRILLSVGRLTYQKGFDMIPAIARSLVDGGCDNFEWWIVGDGEDRESIARKIKELGVERFVKLRGSVKDMSSVYGKSAMFVSTSRFEGLPLVLLEAKQHKLPIVSFDYLLGVREIVRDGTNGIVVKLGDVDKMSGEIADLLNDKKRRAKFSSASQMDVDKFSREDNMAKWSKLLEEVASE